MVSSKNQIGNIVLYLILLQQQISWMKTRESADAHPTHLLVWYQKYPATCHPLLPKPCLYLFKIIIDDWAFVLPIVQRKSIGLFYRILDNLQVFPVLGNKVDQGLCLGKLLQDQGHFQPIICGHLGAFHPLHDIVLNCSKMVSGIRWEARFQGSRT